MSNDFGSFPGGVSGIENQKGNRSPWYKRWYVWLLPLLVLLGTLLFAYN